MVGLLKKEERNLKIYCSSHVMGKVYLGIMTRTTSLCIESVYQIINKRKGKKFILGLIVSERFGVRKI